MFGRVLSVCPQVAAATTGDGIGGGLLPEEGRVCSF